MTFDEMLQKSQELAEEALADAEEVSPKLLGLDARSAPYLWHGTDFLAVMLCHDGTLQYYGGFEYVKPEFKQHLGEYVFYSTDDCRVEEHWSRFSVDEEDEICGQCNGSGEGMYDGTKCSSCHGSGVEAPERDE